MNNIIWQLTPNERLKEWRSFRKELDELDDKECLQTIVDFWRMAPLSNRVIDPYDSKEWPNPWNMLWEGKFDENAIALGMAYTLELCDWSCEVLLVQNTKKSYIGLVVRVDDEYILNYNYGAVDNESVLDKCEVLNTWHSEDLVK